MLGEVSVKGIARFMGMLVHKENSLFAVAVNITNGSTISSE